MIDDVQRCIDLRIDYFDKYMDIPPAVQGDVDSFFRDLTALGEQCRDATEFENAFNSQGYANRFNALIPKCKPKPYKVTKEDKKLMRKTAKEMLKENKEMIVNDALDDIALTARVEVTNKVLKENRERMIENDTFDDYTRTANRVRDVKDLFGFISKKLKK